MNVLMKSLKKSSRFNYWKNKGYLAILTFMLTAQSEVAYATAGDVQGRINGAVDTIINIILSIAVGVGIAMTGWIAVKKMLVSDDPQEKSEAMKSIGRVWMLVGIAAAARWLVPWVWNLFA